MNPRCTTCDNTGWVPAPYGRGVVRCDCRRATESGPVVPFRSDDDALEGFIAFLRVHARGRSRAMTRRQIAARFPLLARRLGGEKGLDRRLRQLAHLANQRMIPVVSGNAGYWYAVDASDFDDVIARIDSQVRDELARIAQLKAMRDRARQAGA